MGTQIGKWLVKGDDHINMLKLTTQLTARNKPTETPSAKVTIFRNTNTQLPLKPFCNFQGVIL